MRSRVVLGSGWRAGSWGVGLATLAVLTGCGASTRSVERRGGDAGSGGASPAGMHQGGALADGGVGGVGGRGGVGGIGAGAGSGGTTTPDAGAAGESHQPEACGISGTSQIPRLKAEQYARTVRDLLGVTHLSALDKAPIDLLAGVDHAGDITQADWDAYRAAADAIAAQVMADPESRSRFLACELSGDGQACLHDSIVKFGRRAFRRPLTDSEIQRFDSLVAQGAELTATGTPEEIAEVLLVTFLVSPSFLQRSELSQTLDADGRIVLSPHEIASRLSYLLWGSAPDEELDQVADAGELTTKEQILAQAERLVAHANARDLVAAFHRTYLQAGPNTYWTGQTHDAEKFPTYSEATPVLANQETERFFDAIVFDRLGAFEDLLLSPLGFVNASTAPFYGLDPSAFGDELEAVTFDPVARPGFLTRIGFLGAFSNWQRSSPLLRGGFIAKQVLGLEIGLHPDVSNSLPAGDFATNREFMSTVTAGAACAACHASLVNPPGFVLEAYNAVGSWQTNEADTGAPIDTHAEILVDGAAVPVADPAELMAVLAASKEAKRAYARSWVAFGYERDPNTTDDCTVDELAAKMTAGGYSVLDLILDLTQTDAFRLRAREEAL